MKRIYLPAALLLLVANLLILTRMTLGHVRLDTMKPVIRHHLSLQMEVTSHGDPVSLKVFLPRTLPQQTLSTEKVESTRLAYTLTTDSLNRRATWYADDADGRETALYEAEVEIHPVRYVLPRGVAIPSDYPAALSDELQPTATIQSDDPHIVATAKRLVDERGANDIAGTIRALYDFVQNEIHGSDYENTLDAATTLKWGEAFCGGKSRLLAALLRASHIPARMVGGIILAPGSKRITHVWVEAWVNGVWVPLDALNHHYAEYPENYLTLYYGDQSLFVHSADVNFQYRFDIKRWRTSPDEALTNHVVSALNPYTYWEAFRESNISLNLLRIILLMPLGALFVVIVRNVIGITTYGTFQPALLAVAFRDTGLLWGAALYVAVLVIGMLVRRALDRVQLLQTPRLSILLVFVVLFMFFVTYGSVRAGTVEPAHVSLFPIAILALTVENFFTTTLEHGSLQAIRVLAQTLLVVAGIYLMMDSYFVQSVVFLFPEVLLGVVAASLVLGRWTGLRLTEYRRFRLLLAHEGA